MTLFLGPLHTILQKGGYNKDGTCGKPFWGVKTKLLNVDPVTKEGEIAVYTRNTFMGYIKVSCNTSFQPEYLSLTLSSYQEEQKTRDTFTEDGLMWKSGDLGILDSEGHVRITGLCAITGLNS